MKSSDGGGNPPLVDEIACDVLRFVGIENTKNTSNEKEMVSIGQTISQNVEKHIYKCVKIKAQEVESDELVRKY